MSFIELYTIQFFQALAQNLGSTNFSVRKLTEGILARVNEGAEKNIFVQPLVSMIQFGNNARLKPFLID
jgi:hypothetical protein